MSAIQQVALMEPLKEPPYRLDVVVAAGDVGVLIVQPIPDAIREVLPLFLILEDTLSRTGIELLDPETFDVFLAGELQLLLDLDLHG
jgi:hypothetical protein